MGRVLGGRAARSPKVKQMTLEDKETENLMTPLIWGERGRTVTYAVPHLGKGRRMFDA